MALVRTSGATSLLKHLIDSPALVREVRALPAPAFSKLVRQVGDEDLFSNSRPGERETFDPRRFVTWLEVLQEAGDAVAATRVAELSEDFVAHALNALVLVLDQDVLRDSLGDGGDDAEYVDKQLESSLSEELDNFLVVARGHEGWDAVVALLLALDRDHRALLERLLDRCAAASRQLVDDLEALGTTLSEGASLAEDAEAEPDERRSQRGFVEPRDARSFLTLAEEGKGGAKRDPIAQAYFRGLDRSARAQQPPPAPETTRLLALVEQWSDDDPRPARVTADRRALPGRASVLVEALQALREVDEAAFDARMAELAFLSNVLVAGAELHADRLRLSDASEAALATVELGAELAARQPEQRANVDTLREVLAARSADGLFREASAALAKSGFKRAWLLTRSEVEGTLARVRGKEG